MKFPTFSFFKHFGSAKVDDVGVSLIELIVRFDPKAASEAQIMEFEQQLDFLTANVSKARTDFLREKAEADTIEARYKKLLRAAEIIEVQIVDPANIAKKAALENSLGKLIGEVESILPEVDREKQEATEADKTLREYEAAAEQAAEKLIAARANLTKAQRDVDRSELQKNREEENAEQKAILAGIRKKTNNMGTVLSVMNEQAQKNREEADAFKLKAKLLSKGGDGTVETDANVAAALASIDAKPKVSLTDRLAALKSRTAPAPVEAVA